MSTVDGKLPGSFCANSFSASVLRARRATFAPRSDRAIAGRQPYPRRSAGHNKYATFDFHRLILPIPFSRALDWPGLRLRNVFDLPRTADSGNDGSNSRAVARRQAGGVPSRPRQFWKFCECRPDLVQVSAGWRTLSTHKDPLTETDDQFFAGRQPFVLYPTGRSVCLEHLRAAVVGRAGAKMFMANATGLSWIDSDRVLFSAITTAVKLAP